MNKAEIAQLRSAIESLEAQRSLLGDAVVAAALGPMREKLATLLAAEQPEHQRKQMTVLFADVVGSTQLGLQLDDPEVVLEIMDDALRRMALPVQAHNGRVLRFMGDGLMAAFGLDQAREDDAEQAVHAGLAILQAASTYAEKLSAERRLPGFAVRVGINTGLIASGGYSEGQNTIMGLDVNLAARLEAGAPPGGLLISHFTYRLVRGLFDVTPLEPIAAKGFSEPVPVYRVMRAKPRGFRMATRGIEGVETRMVGRDAELSALRDAFGRLMDGSAAEIITIIGDAGVGKSRLLYEFENWVELQPQRVYYFKGRATPARRHTPFGLFRDLFANRFGIYDSDSAVVALEKFRSGMMLPPARLEAGQADIAGHWLGFDFASSPAVAALLGSPQFGSLAQAYLTDFFHSLMERQPVILLLEDIHWADDNSLDLVNRLVAAVDSPIFSLCLARPSLFEDRPDWGSRQPGFSRIHLSPLTVQDGLTLVDELLQRMDVVPPSLRDLIIENADGNPFYMEELVKMMIDQDVIVRGEDAWRVAHDRLDTLRVPPTLTSLLQARLESLPRPEREILQQASVVGRLFWDQAVAAVEMNELAVVSSLLQAIRGRELIYRRERSSFAQTEEYSFNHALQRDVTYETVLLRQRRKYHLRVAEWLEAHAAERLGEYLGVIGDHLAQADRPGRASDYLERSGDQAMATNAYAAARRQYERALLLRRQANDGDQAAAADLLRKAGWASLELGDLQAAEEALTPAVVAAVQSGRVATQAAAQIGLARVASNRGGNAEAQALAEKTLPLAKEVGGEILIRTYMLLQLLNWTQGDLDAAEGYLLEALALARDLGEVRFEIMALNRLGNIATDRPDIDTAQGYYDEALRLVRQTGNKTEEIVVNNALGTLNMKRGEPARARPYYEAALVLARQLGRQLNVALILGNLAEVSLDLGDPTTAGRQLVEGLGLAARTGSAAVCLGILFSLGRLKAATGDLRGALHLFGLARHHPAGHHQFESQIAAETQRMDLPAAEIDAGLTAGAALDLDAVVEEILAG